MYNLSLARTTYRYYFSDDEEIESDTQFPDRPALRWFSKLVCLATLLLIFAGALVTSHQAGLAVPDWPTSYGYNMFLFPVSQWQGNIFFEHVHRLIASGVGFLALILTVWIGRVEERRWVRVVTFGALLAVILQGVLGGLTVLYQLPDLVSTAHGVLGQSFFVMTIAIAYSQSLELRNGLGLRKVKQQQHLLRLALISTMLVYMQLIIGALMRHTDSGLALPDFPRMGGTFVPSLGGAWLDNVNLLRAQLGLRTVGSEQVLIHVAHRISGFVVVLGSVLLGWRLVRFGQLNTPIRRSGFSVGALVVLQFFLGAATVLSVRNPIITSIHVWLGAILLGLHAIVVLRLYAITVQPQSRSLRLGRP